jgi:transglutaminase/protease-like cytokinesis protein 3
MKRILFIILSLVGLNSYGQDNIIEFDYHKADSIAQNLSIIKYKSSTEIAIALTKNLNTEHEKFRAIFRWIADSINYSFSNTSTDPELVIKKGIAVCAGYSSLLKAMCDSIGLECIIINGFAKIKSSDIGKDLKKTNHAWNAIKLSNKWYLVDVTWASGKYDYQTNKFFKAYDNTYFLADPDYFYKDHFPENRTLFLSHKKTRKSTFINSPIYYSGFKNYNIKTISPSNGEITLKLSDPLKIIVASDNNIPNFYFGLNTEKYLFTPTLLINDNNYILKYKFSRPSNSIFTLYINNEAVVSYKIKIKK